MKLIIDIPNYNLKEVQNGSIASKVLLEAIKNGIPYEERPKGEWIEVQKGIIVTEYKCPFCGRTVKDDTGYDVASDYPFCHCGANMRGRTNEKG